MASDVVPHSHTVGADMRARSPGSLFPFALVFCTALSLPAHAQRTEVSAVRASDNAVAALPPQSRLALQDAGPRRSGYEIPTRTFLGVGGAFIGALGGAYAGAAVLPHGPCGCDDPGLTQALQGAAVGSALLGAVLASAPQFSSSCHPVRRLGYGVLGALAGALAGGAAGATTGFGGVLLGYFVGAGVGAGVASAVC